jgi:hypothetical protein
MKRSSILTLSVWMAFFVLCSMGGQALAEEPPVIVPTLSGLGLNLHLLAVAAVGFLMIRGKKGQRNK